MGRPAPHDLLERIADDAASPGEAAGPAQVVVDGIEVTQAVQDHLNSVPLVAGKRTVVRVYLSYAAGPVSVRGVLRVGRVALGAVVRHRPDRSRRRSTRRASGSSLAALLSRRHEPGLQPELRPAREPRHGNDRDPAGQRPDRGRTTCPSRPARTPR